jgi:hypothetical protein
MDESDLVYSEIGSIKKTHREILEKLEEIKDFEKNFIEFNIEKPQVDEELIEIEYETFEEIESELLTFKEVEEKKPDFKIRRKKVITEMFEKPITPTTFRLRINKEGNLENIDLIKPKPRSKPHFRFRKKDQSESEVTEKKSRLAKLKSGLGKIKRAIPYRREEEEETEESETSEAFV